MTIEDIGICYNQFTPISARLHAPGCGELPWHECSTQINELCQVRREITQTLFSQPSTPGVCAMLPLSSPIVPEGLIEGCDKPLSGRPPNDRGVTCLRDMLYQTEENRTHYLSRVAISFVRGKQKASNDAFN